MCLLFQILKSNLRIFCSHLTDVVGLQVQDYHKVVFVVILSSSIKFLLVIYKYCFVKMNFKKYLLLVLLWY